MYYLIKVEINGIQEFIFNIKSKGAAKALKARSFFIEGICQLVAKKIESTLSNTEIIFSGGGNVYAKIPSSDWKLNEWEVIRQETQVILTTFNLFCSFSYFEWSEGNYAEALSALNKIALKEKYSIHKTGDTIFKEFQADTTEQLSTFIEFSCIYSRSSSFKISTTETIGQAVMTANEIQLGQHLLKLESSNGTNQLLPLPVWTSSLIDYYNKNKSEVQNERDEEDQPESGNIISFNHMAAFAKIRTGTGKLAVLKLDIDNLGKIFKKLGTEDANRRLSEQINSFFSREFKKILGESFISFSRIKSDGKSVKEKDTCLLDNKTHFLEKFKLQEEKFSYRENIYTVYAGGDDCFVLGAWDAVVNFAATLHEKFDQFQRSYLKGQSFLKNPITLSAALLLIDPHFPVVRIAELADDALTSAKQAGYNSTKLDAADNPMKSCIHFMGHTFSWESFKEITEVKDCLIKLVQEWGAPRAVLQRIIHSFEGTDNMYWQECNPVKPFHPALLWRFMYSFRDIKHEPYFRNRFEKTFFGQGGYETKFVWDDFTAGKKLSQVLPIAARWAELLSKK